MYIEKEMMVMFIYDVDNCEEEDPLSSILYFHPNWVSDQHRSLVCNQVVGTMQFLKGTFEEPNLLALQSGKFSVHHSGSYVLALGSDRNIPDWVLEHRINNLKSLISFFHNNIETIASKFENRNQLSEKLYSTFETYAKILQYSGNMFINIPTWILPKSASNIFLEAMQILQAGQELPHILGGAVLYHNKVIATQFDSKMTRRLIISDPYRIQSPAERANVKFILPEGVQILEVYLSNEEMDELEKKKKQILLEFPSPAEEGENVGPLPTCSAQAAVEGRFEEFMKPAETKPEAPLLSFMKRDRSLIFTTLHEEEVSQDSSPTQPEEKTEKLPAYKPELFAPKRPKHLNLRLRLTSLRQNEPETASAISGPSRVPNAASSTVCSTPVGNKVLHDNILSICSNLDEAAEDTAEKTAENLEKTTDDLTVQDDPSPTSNLLNKLSKSLSDIPRQTDVDDDDDEEDKEYKKVYSKTIADPMYPVFHPNGKIDISSVLHRTLLGKHMKLLNAEVQHEFKEKVATWKKQMINEKRKKQKRAKLLATFAFDQEVVRRTKDMRRQSLNLPLRPFAPLVSSGATPKREVNEYPESTSNHCLTPLIPNKCFPDFALANPTRKILNHRRFSLAKNFTFNPAGLSKIALKHLETIANKKELSKALLFICGYRDIVMAFVLQEEAKFCQELVHKLAKICNENFHLLETQLVQCFSMHRQNTTTLNETEPYSYLSVDLEWDSVQRAGPWGVTELGTLTHLHRDFQYFGNITEIIVKNEESVIYGNMCGKTEIFYQQCAPYNAGLPNPADIMATVAIKARRRLERDSSIMLL